MSALDDEKHQDNYFSMNRVLMFSIVITKTRRGNILLGNEKAIG